MTVLAWDGSTLSADKRVTFGGTILTCTKIERWNNSIIGFSGDSDLGFALMSWLKYQGCNPDKFPRGVDKDNWARLLVVNPNRTLHLYERFPEPVVYEPQIFATGSGMDYAMAVMHMGFDSAKAVEVASALDPGCGNGIDSLELYGDAL